MAEEKKRGLGMGLSALLGEDTADSPVSKEAPTSEHSSAGNGTQSIPVEFLHPGRYQPRHVMDQKDLEELASSIKAKGVLQPLLVRPHPDIEGQFEIIAGERRWRASQLAQLHEVPVLVKDLDDQTTLEVALIENLQRQDLSALDEAEGYQRLMDEFSHTQDVLSKAVGKSRSHVANMLRLLGLPEDVKGLLEAGDLSAGHARALLGAEDVSGLAKKVILGGLNVRQTEQLIKSASDSPKKPAKSASKSAKDSDTKALEEDLTNLLGLKVEIAFKAGKGSISVHYDNLEQLDDILHRLTHGAHGAGVAADS